MILYYIVFNKIYYINIILILNNFKLKNYCKNSKN